MVSRHPKQIGPVPWAVVSALAVIAVIGAVSPTWGATYKEGTVSNGGTLTGMVKYSGKAPAPGVIKISKDNSACGDQIASETLIVGAGGALANAVVEIQGVKKGKQWNLPTKFVYDQKKCAFSPHVMIIRPRAAGAVHNSDSVKHNVHTISKGIFNVNKTVAPGKSLKIKKKKIKKPGTVFVKCDFHNWMGGWWIVAASPYITLTDAKGGFQIKDIPAGKYKVRIWQEKLGEQIKNIEIKKGATTALAVSLTKK